MFIESRLELSLRKASERANDLFERRIMRSIFGAVWDEVQRRRILDFESYEVYYVTAHYN
jgi:hypothetical protein